MGLFSWGKRTEPPPPRPRAAVPDGLRVYAIGDVHGRFDLLEQLLGLIRRDLQARAPAETHVVLLGDLIDRGPQSREVIDLFLNAQPDFATFHFVMGNHEEMLLRIIDEADPDLLMQFLKFGGRETFASYGVSPETKEQADRPGPEDLLSHIPEEHRSFIRGMCDGIQFGDYFFTHAGVRPGIPIDEQERQDLRWIRGPFLDSDADHGLVVVHGHTISETPEVRRNRIGIDTGAYVTGVLTALGLEGTQRWLVRAQV